MHRARRTLLPVLLPIFGLVAACSEDDDGAADTNPDSGMADTPTSTNGGFGRDDNRNDDNGDDNEETSNPPVSLPPAVPVPDPVRMQCGDAACRDTLVGDIVVHPCCPSDADDRCGLDLDAVSGFMSLQGGCTELERPGKLDPVCPSVFLDDAVNPRELAGCCNAQGQCGVMADLSDLLANFGCVNPDTFIAGRAPASPPEPMQSPAEPQDGVHLLDGGGYFVTDAGLDAGTTAAELPDLEQECVPPPPPPDPVDAGPSQPSDASTPSDAGPTDDSDSSAPNPPNARDAGPDASSPAAARDAGGSAEDASAPSTPSQDAAADGG